MAVDHRRVVLFAGRLIQDKVRKECPYVVSGSARCTTLRDEDEVCVFGRNADNVLRVLSHAGAWGQCVTVHSDNK